MPDPALTTAALAAALGITEDRCRRVAHKLGLGTPLWERSRPPRSYTPEDMETIRRYIKDHPRGRHCLPDAVGETTETWPNASEVAALIGRSRQSVSSRCQRGRFGPGNAVKLGGIWRINPAAVDGSFAPPANRGGRPRKER